LPSSESKSWKYLEERFGVKRKEITKYKIIERSGDYWIVSKNFGTVKNDLEIDTAGLRLLRKTGIGLKPTTYALQLLENQIKKNIVTLEKNELLKLLKREKMIPRKLDEEGYVALKYKGRIIGCGMYKDNVVSSRIPKGRSKEFAEMI